MDRQEEEEEVQDYYESGWWWRPLSYSSFFPTKEPYNNNNNTQTKLPRCANHATILHQQVSSPSANEDDDDSDLNLGGEKCVYVSDHLFSPLPSSLATLPLPFPGASSHAGYLPF